jgi:hypothetical protein
VATPATLAPAGGAKVPSPLSITARRDKIALAIELTHVHGNSAPLSAPATPHGQAGNNAESHQQGIDHPADKPAGPQVPWLPTHFNRYARDRSDVGCTRPRLWPPRWGPPGHWPGTGTAPATRPGDPVAPGPRRQRARSRLLEDCPGCRAPSLTAGPPADGDGFEDRCTV